jgi:hypothetical protein
VPLSANPGCCEEASLYSREFYIPCNRPAEFLVQTKDKSPYRMCDMCTDHNVRNRGAHVIATYPLTLESNDAPHS